MNRDNALALLLDAPFATWVLLSAAVVLAAAAAWMLLSAPRYTRCKRLLTQAEGVFHRGLEKIAGDRWDIHGKVRMADVITPAGREGRRAWWQAFRKISSKHVDFVLCDPDSSEIVLAIELDDRSHKQGKRRERDRFVDQAFAQAGVPLLRVRTQRRYDLRKLKQKIAVAIGEEPEKARPRVLRGGNRGGVAAAG